MKKKANQEFIVAGVCGATGLFILAMSWSDFTAVAGDHPAVTMFALGLVLIFMAVGNLSTGLKKRSWLKQVEKQLSTTTDSTLSTEGAPSVEK